MKYSLSFLLLIGTLLVFQNCGEGLMATKISTSQVDFGSQSDLIYGHNSELLAQKTNTEVQPLYSNRMLTYNIFISVFGNSIKTELVETIAWASSDFGSGWDIYQKRRQSNSDCNKSKNPHYRCDNDSMIGHEANISGASAPREGRRMAACQLGVENDSSLLHAFRKIDENSSLQQPPEANRENFKRAFQLFFRGKPLPGEDFFDALNLVHRKTSDKKEAWKQIVLGTCLSPHWQVL